MKELRDKVERMIADLQIKIVHSIPDEGNFPMVYSEFKIEDRDMCLTDIMLKIIPIPNHLPYDNENRWLELVGYKLPAPYKATTIIFKGSTDQILDYLNKPEAFEKIMKVIPRLDYNLSDI